VSSTRAAYGGSPPAGCRRSPCGVRITRMAAVGNIAWVHAFIAVPRPSASLARVFWTRALGWPTGVPWDAHPEFTSLVPPDGDPYVHFQQVGDDAPRVHLDVVVDDLDEARARLVSLGARVGARLDYWQVMRSPGGLPFCLCREPAAGVRPGGTTQEGGHRSRLAQVCIDAPAWLFDRELAFWQRATGWQAEPQGRPEFTGLPGPAEATVRLLLQRLGRNDTAATVRAHLDLGSDDIDAEAGRLRRLGAKHVSRFPGWVRMVDTLGMPFCVTGRPPE
jgi:hypothetical protein